MALGHEWTGRIASVLGFNHEGQSHLKSMVFLALVCFVLEAGANLRDQTGRSEKIDFKGGKRFMDPELGSEQGQEWRRFSPGRAMSSHSTKEFHSKRWSPKPSINGEPYNGIMSVNGRRLSSKGTPVGGEFNVLDYGADPSGGKDSWNAIQATIDAAQKQLFSEMAVGGYAVVSLAGGDYVISKPLNISGNPHGFIAGRLTIRDGGLVAGWNDTDQYLLQGDFSSVDLESLNLDAGHHGGCINMDMHDQSFVHNVFFSHFSTIGLNIGDGHELLLDECNFEEYTFGEDPHAMTHNFTGTAIYVGSPDNHFTNSVIKCCKQGIITRGANIFSRLHLWPDCGNVTIADSYAFIAGPQTRIWGSYMDGSGVLLADAYNVHILDSLFYGPHAELIFNFTDFRHQSWMHDIIVRQNMFKCVRGCPQIKTSGLTDAAKMILRDVVVRDNHFDNASTTVATYAQKSIVATAREFVVDFTGMLLFPMPVQNCHIQYSFQLLTPNAQIESHYLIPSKGLYDVRVFVVHPNSEVNITGRVYASVDQSSCVIPS